MIPELLCRNLCVWSLQIAILIAAGGSLCLLLRFGPPQARLRFWHALLMVSLLLPLLPVRRTVRVQPNAAAGSTQISIVTLPGSSPVPERVVSEAILVLLAAGSVFRLGWLGLGCWQLRRYRRRAEPLGRIPDSVRLASAQLATAGDFYISSDVASPVTFGFRHPTLLLPPSFFDLAPDAQRAVITHELLHLRRNDWVFVLAEEFIRAVFWFHPAIWWLLAQIQLTREQAVDRAAIEHTRDRDRYVDALLAIALTQVRADLAPAPLFLRKRQLARRVAALVQGTIMSKRRFIASLATMASVLAMAAAATLWQFPLTAGVPTDTPSADAPKDSQPKLIKGVPPVYPADAKAAGIEGSVTLSVEIDATGHVTNVDAVSGPELLRQAAIDAVKDWTFEPKIVQGEAVPFKSSIAINFRLDKPEDKAEKAPAAGYVPPKLINHVMPVYPPEAKAAKIQGMVLLNMLIDKTGHVTSATVISGPEELRQSAIDAATQWVFQPATQNGEPVEAQPTTTEINFTLQ